MLEKENQVLSELAGKFDCLSGKGVVPAQRRIFLDVPEEIFPDVLKYARNELKFVQLCTITGLDAGDCFQFIYHIADDEGTLLNLKRSVPKDHAVITSVLDSYNGAIFYERELEDLLGVKVEGLPEGRHYPLPDNWPQGQYPQRKDWDPESLSQIK
ncbi:MAG: NADH-quinone oxidoreductase subunit C [Clostridia bacterium]|nr:NADH-quinone oxidoreductase subunit C [Clostridia bacterium]MDR3644582.1 NADH-quinone oxidoreductase subunit C [Clostridia bacterium]